ncbi:hypothetical protein BGAL_0065g00250 [Botrytis galanthina]|uniref:Uncharacterized protein n=1 Tax=Botrytis galanthina TaxID=278940 RepID=A0A4V4HVE6_9HELO|nr:hypothetical protein BGAL_0065g00250 [Botrytis galanthina]
MNVAHKTLLEVGYKEGANFTIGGRDREGYQMNFENARAWDKCCEDDEDDTRDRLIGHFVNGKDEVLLWIRYRAWEQAMQSGCWNERGGDRRKKASIRRIGSTALLLTQISR